MRLYKQKNKTYPVLTFLDIKSAYDTVDKNIIWKSLKDNNIPTPLLTTLQLLFNNVQLEVILNGLKSTNPFTPTTGVLQGSTLSPHLYSIYINSLPQILRSTPATNSPQYEKIRSPYDRLQSLTINSLLFADDIVIIGSAENTQHLLDIAQQHSFDLGYRFNPIKSAIILPPHIRNNTNNTTFTLYDSPIPIVPNFKYLGITFNSNGIDNKSMIVHNATKGTQSMKILHSLGANSTGFDKYLSFRFFKCFVRPIFEYGLPLLTPNKKEFKIIEDAQDNACRLIMNGHKSSSTHVIKHMNNLTDMSNRMIVLGAKNLVRVQTLPSDSLLTLFMQQQLLKTRSAFLKKLQKKNPIWQKLIAPLNLQPRSTQPILIPQYRLKNEINTFLLQQWHLKQEKFILAGKCRNMLGNDPIMYIPMTIFERSRIIRWRMGWLPGRPKPCKNCNNPTSSTTPSHVTSCFQINENLNYEINTLLNMLPKSPPKTATKKTFWKSKWIILSQFLYNVEKICLPDPEEINPDSADNTPFLNWISKPAPRTTDQIIEDIATNIFFDNQN
jgi:hypothetical protein